MSHAWISFPVRRDFPPRQGLRMLSPINYSRHVCLVTPIQRGQHIIAMNKIIAEKMINKPVEAQVHAHDINLNHKEFCETELINAEKEYATTGKPKRSSKPNGKAK